TVFHPLSLTVGTRHRARVEMVAADHNRCSKFPARHHLVKGKTETMPVTKSDPTDACGQALEFDARPRHVEPIVQMLIVRHQFFDLGIGTKNVFRVARQRSPAERPNAAAEQWADIGGYASPESERAGKPPFLCHLADIISAIARSRAPAP